MIKNLILVAAGSAFGGVIRYLIGYFLPKWAKIGGLWATFSANILACLLLGVFIGYFHSNKPTDLAFKLCLATGFCGGLSTFSTLSYETLQKIQQQQLLTAFIYQGSSLFAGILALWVGLWLANRLLY